MRFHYKIAVLLMSAALLVVPTTQAQAWNNGAASTPPMGWNSYDSYNWNVTEAQVKANADYMRDNLRQYGWQYIVIDWAWYYPGSGTGSPNQDANLQPRLRLDGNGRPLPDTTRFPSATGTNGFKPLADYLHAAGLKFGVHLMRASRARPSPTTCRSRAPATPRTRSTTPPPRPG
ncbi:alpha-amylase family protein [Dactylosporangium cerinum]